MTAKKKPPLLGPDGKPLDVAKYRPQPKVADGPVREIVTYTFNANYEGIREQVLQSIYGFSPLTAATPKPKATSMRAAVEKHLASVHAELPEDWYAFEEIPAPPPELTDTYSVAFGSAARKCPHENSRSTLYAARERQCDDCGRYFTRKEWYER